MCLKRSFPVLSLQNCVNLVRLHALSNTIYISGRLAFILPIGPLYSGINHHYIRMTGVPGSSQFQLQRPAKSRHPKPNAPVTMMAPILELCTRSASSPIHVKAFRHCNKTAGVDPDFINVVSKAEPAPTVGFFHKFVTVDLGNRKDHQLSQGFRTVKFDRPESQRNSCAAVNQCD